MLKRKYFLWFIPALVLCLVLPFSASGQEKVIKIGGLYPMTGRAGLYGLDSVDAAEMAIEEINGKAA